MYNILKAPNEVLSQQAKPIQKIDASVKKLIKDMAVTLASARDPEGIGLAAPQIGKSVQLFIIKESKDADLKVFINPVLKTPKTKLTKPKKGIKEGKKTNEVRLEGCLSLGDIWGAVTRYPTVTLSYEDENGENHTNEFSGFLATIIQHEYDHLQGILFPRRVLEQNGSLYQSKKDKKGEMVFEEMPI